MSLQIKLGLIGIMCSLLILGCDRNTGEGPPPVPDPPTPQSGYCGDEICDEEEEKNPDLCPVDCYTPGIIEPAPEEDEARKAPLSGFGSGSWTCLVDKGEAGQDSFSAEFEIDFTVELDGSITGTGWGVFTSAECQLAGCLCEFDPDDIDISVSGRKVDDKFNMQIKPYARMTQTTTCPNIGTNTNDMIGLLLGCQPANEGFHNFTIEAQEGATYSFIGGITDNITGEGSVVIHLKNE